MRRITFLFLVILGVLAFNINAQVPEKFNYQAVVKDNQGELITSQSISVQLSIIESTSGGSVLYRETHSVTTTNEGMISLLVGGGTVNQGNFSTINWGVNSKFIKVEINAGSGLVDMGTFQLLTVPYALHANTSNTADVADALGSNSIYSPDSDTLFVVKDHDGNVVFAVFPDGAQVIVNESAVGKAKAGGFAVSGRSPSKDVISDYLVVTADSTRVYVNEPIGKAKAGGFAISGRSPSKEVMSDYLFVTADSTRVYINEPVGKAKAGGFAISGRSPSKGVERDYFNVSGAASAQLVDGKSQIFWYPEKSALLAGDVYVGDPDSVGTNSTALGYRNIAKGDWSQALGFQSKALGDYSTAIGNEAEAQENSLAVGYQAKASGVGSYALGSGALAIGDKSFAFGSVGIDSAGLVTGNTQATGEYAFAFGLGAEASDTGAFALGSNVLASGYFSTAVGYYTTASNLFSTSMGAHTEASGIFSTGNHVSGTL